MVYGRLVKQHLEEKARARAETTLGGGYSASSMATKNAASRLQEATECAPRPHPVKNSHVANKTATADSPAQPPRQYVRRFRTQPAAASPPRRRSPDVRGRSRKRSRTPPRNPSKKRDSRPRRSSGNASPPPISEVAIVRPADFYRKAFSGLYIFTSHISAVIISLCRIRLRARRWPEVTLLSGFLPLFGGPNGERREWATSMISREAGRGL